MKIIKISQLMTADHALIQNLLDKFSKAALESNLNITIASFAALKQKLEHHFKVEEEAIFQFIKPTDSAVYGEVPLLIKQHDLIISLLEQMKDQLTSQGFTDVHKFRRTLYEHKDLESNSLYHKLDQVLNREQKNIIIKNLKAKLK